MGLFEFRALTAINYTLLRYIPGKGYVIAASQGPWCQCNGYRSLPWDYHLQCFLWMKQASPRPSNSSKLSLREGIQVSPSVSLCFVPSHLCQKQWVQGLCLNFLSIPVQVVAVDIPTHWRGRYYLLHQQTSFSLQFLGQDQTLHLWGQSYVKLRGIFN